MEFSRALWVSQHAKDLWQPRINRIVSAWTEVELKAVYQGYRKAALQVDSWPTNPKRFVTVGLGTQAKAASYLAGSEKPRSGEPFSVRTVTIRGTSVSEFIHAFNNHDDDTLGLLLGYPPCCIHFFGDTWTKGLIDPTERMMVPQETVTPESNILLRWMGVRPVPHMPCSTNCAETVRQGKLYLGLLPAEEREWAYELLGMNFNYSTLNGIAEISTPIFKLAVSSQGKRDFRLLGNVPDGTVSGTKFPFIYDCWTLNGFRGPASMNRAHEVILRVTPLSSNVVVDFGCGNGRLLHFIGGRQFIGIDINVPALIQARKLYGDCQYIVGDIHKTRVPSHDLSILTLGRLIETDSPSHLLSQLADKVVIYTYGDHNHLFQELKQTYFGNWNVLAAKETDDAKAALIGRIV